MRTTSGGAGSGRPGLVGQLVRFTVVGVISVLVDFAVYTAGLHLGLPTVVARALSAGAGATTAYALNRRWAFQVSGGGRRVAAFAVLYGIAFAVILATNALALAALPESSWRVNLAWAVSQGIGTAVNFTGLRLVVFRP